LRTIATGALAFVLILAGTACEKSVSADASGRRLTLTKPTNQSLKRGETEQVGVSIGREKFTGPVKVKFTKLPQGVTVVVNKEIASDQTSADYTLHAANEADLVENHEAAVTAEGPDGLATTQTFLITVKDKK
jgi:hypothetical protein